MNHTTLINHLIAKHNLKSYLEIGVQNPANNFYKINCNLKYGVDPEVYNIAFIEAKTSDDFFKNINSGGCVVLNIGLKNETVLKGWDLIFIDGYHSADQVKKDFENSLKCLNDGGYVVIHDVLPENEKGSLVPRQEKRWWGDVYKFAMTLKHYDGIDFITYDFDEGCCVVWKDASKKAVKGKIKPTWENYIKHRKELLNIKNELVESK